MKQTELYAEVLSFLSSVASESGNFSTDMLANIQNRNIKLQDSEIYIRQELQANGSSPDLFEKELQKIVGENLFDGNKLDTGRYFVATAIRVTYGVADIGTSRGLVDYTNNLPTTLLNGQIIQKIDSNIIMDLPIKSIVDAVNTDSYKYNFNKFLLFRDNKILNAETRIPSGGDLGLAVGKAAFIEVRYIGFETSASKK
ncbi:hypothetical protein IMCC3317_10960 [Kordia antarctica]|uniref:Uncharacterized protein n=1 Tax=Kordia antarctica TaxID=1218801 RepID=A0A7L4ZG73_9FLAO|nr:hypothetical protein [Kordia antarctica]QHI35748.1 hypothetical protein IMCC3317_10960 [Kordia antarctica]